MAVAREAVNCGTNRLDGSIAVAGSEAILIATEVATRRSSTAADIRIGFQYSHRLAVCTCKGTIDRSDVVGAAVAITLAISPAITPPNLTTGISRAALPTATTARRGFAVVFGRVAANTCSEAVEHTTGRTNGKCSITTAVTAVDRNNTIAQRTTRGIGRTMLVAATATCNAEHILSRSRGVAIFGQTTSTNQADCYCRSAAAGSTKQVAVAVTSLHRCTTFATAIIATSKLYMNFTAAIRTAVFPKAVIDSASATLYEVELCALLRLDNQFDVTARRGVRIHCTATGTIEVDFVGASIGDGIQAVRVAGAACAFQLVIDLRTGALLIDVEVDYNAAFEWFAVMA